MHQHADKLGLMAAALLVAGPVGAQMSFKDITIVSSLRADGEFSIPESGLVRLRLEKSETEPWQLDIVDPVGVVTTISDESFEHFRVYDRTIEVAVPSGGDVRLLVHGALTKVVWESFQSGLSSQPLFRQGGPLEPIDTTFRAVGANSPIVAMSHAVVRLSWAAPYQPTRWCTGVQFKAGSILTNRHCLPPNYDMKAPQGTISVQFGEFIRNLNDVAEVIEARVALAPEAHNVTEKYQRDFAVLTLLKVPKSVIYSSAVIPLATKSDAAKTTLLSVWANDPSFGKVASRGPKCKAKIDLSAVQACGVRSFYHECETEEGSSGSPVIDPSGKIVGLHYLGLSENHGNCALRVEQFLEDVQLLK